MAAPPPPPQIGIFPQFIAQNYEQLVIKEKVFSLSGDSFTVKTVDGRDILQVKGDVLSLSGRKRVLDMQGAPLFDIRKQLIAFHATYFCENPNGERFFDVKSKFSIGTSKAVGTFTSTLGGGQQCELMMKGDFFDRKAEITDVASGQVVATIDRKFFNAAEIIAGQQTYVVTVSPGVDMALIIAMCIALDEKRNEKK